MKRVCSMVSWEGVHLTLLSPNQDVIAGLMGQL